MADIIEIEILEDDTIKFETNKISGVNHLSADQFLSDIENTLGTKRVTKQKTKKHSHHTHIHQH